MKGGVKLLVYEGWHPGPDILPPVSLDDCAVPLLQHRQSILRGAQ